MRGRRLLRYLIFLVAAGVALWLGVPELPSRWNPWAPLLLTDPPNVLTGWKLRRLADEPALCRAILDRSGFTYRPVPDQSTGEGCGFSNAVRIIGADIDYGSSFIATCPLVVALELFERHALQPGAEAAFGQPVVAVAHVGSYACRNVNNREAGRRSQHATANAIDITGFRLRDGTSITLTDDWQRSGPKSDFLHRLHDDACGVFNVVLGPDYNAAHRTHLHFDMGFFSTCR
jgi:hypothetical protein